MSQASRSVLRGALLLSAIGLLASGLLAGVNLLTAERIAEAERQAQLRALAAVLPPERYDNDPLTDTVQVTAPFWLGSDRALAIRRARLDGRIVVLALQTVAPDGYNGDIHLLLGIDRDGRLTGVRVERHRETPGLGDRIEAGRGDWIERFAGLGLGRPPSERWAVRKDGGEFDQFAGATITPRAVVRAVHRSLLFVERHGPSLYAAPTGAELEFSDAPADFEPRR